MEPKDRLKLVANVPDGNSVPSIAQRRGELIAEVLNDNLDQVDLKNGYPELAGEVPKIVRAYGRGKGVKTRARRRPLPVEQPDEQQAPKIPTESQQPAEDLPKPAPTYAPTYAARMIGAGFLAIGSAAAGVGGLINWQFGMEMAGWPGAVLGAVVDGGAMLFWPAAGQLWRQRSWGLWALAFLAGFPFLAGSTYAALNYTGLRIGDYFESRSHVKTGRSELDTSIAEAEKQLGSEKRSVGEIKEAIRRARSFVPQAVLNRTNECQTPTWSREACQGMTAEMEALEHAKARDEWQAKIDGWKAELKGMASVASANPAAEQVAEMSDSKITAAQAQSWWLRWLAAVPGFASIMLTVGLALIGKK